VVVSDGWSVSDFEENLANHRWIAFYITLSICRSEFDGSFDCPVAHASDLLYFAVESYSSLSSLQILELAHSVLFSECLLNGIDVYAGNHVILDDCSPTGKD